MSNWERMAFEPREGQILGHTNGREYYVIKILKTEFDSPDMLIQDINSSQIVLAHGVKKYLVTEDNNTRKIGICWDSGDYYGTDITKIDFKEIRKRYEPNEVLPTKQDDRISVNDYILNHCEKSYSAEYGTSWHLASEEVRADYFMARKQEFLDNTSEKEMEELKVSEDVEDTFAEYEVEITEVLSAKYKIFATDKYEAKDKIKELYRHEEIVLDADNHIDTEFNVSPRNTVPFLENVNQKCR